MNLLRVAVVAAVLGMALPASAGPLEIAFHNGRVTVRATEVPLRVILQEWGKRGQTRVVGLEKLAGAPVTIELVDVPEKQALETLLRSIAGYVAAPRAAAASPEMSSYDRLLLLPTSVVVAAPSAARPAAFAPVRPPVPMAPDPIDLANRDDEEDAEPTPAVVPVVGPTPNPVMAPVPADDRAGQRPPPIPGDPGGTPALMEQTPVQAPPTGPLTSPRPGILPPPQPPQPRS